MEGLAEQVTRGVTIYLCVTPSPVRAGGSDGVAVRMGVTIKDVAARAGVSPSTVSNVLNGRFQRVSPETREQVIAAIRELGYRPNELARSLVRRRSGVIGVLVANINRDPYPAAVRGIDDTCTRHGNNILLSSHYNNPEKERVLLRVLADRQVDGIIMVSQSGRPVGEHVVEYARKGLPIVVINPLSNEHPHVSAIAIDNASGAYESVRHLVRLGHRAIGCIRAFIEGPYAIKSAIERYKGFCRAMADSGLEVDPELVFEGSYANDGGWKSAYNLTMSMLRRKKRPTALVCANDYLALGAVAALREAGVRVPEEIAVIGHDDSVLSRFSVPRLTTVAQPMYEAGAAAVQILQTAIGGQQAARTITLPCTLVVRESCGGAAKAGYDEEGGVEM